MARLPILVLVAEDYEPFRGFLVSTLRNRFEVKNILTVSDCFKAVQEAQRLRPDLILPDIGLPSVNGIEVARQIRKFSPTSKIAFVTQQSSADIVQEALNTGASGYVVKADVGTELLPLSQLCSGASSLWARDSQVMVNGRGALGAKRGRVWGRAHGKRSATS